MKTNFLIVVLLITSFFNLSGECVSPEGLKETHEVVVAYYPIFPRWLFIPPNCPDKVFIGDPENQYPVFGLYTNNTEPGGYEVNVFDFKAMKNAGVTVINPHVVGISGFPTDLFAQIDMAAKEAGIKWTPTFEEHVHSAAQIKDLTSQTINAGYDNIFKVDGKEVFFWYLLDDGNFEYAGFDSPQHAVAAQIEALRAEYGHIRIILDTAGTMGQICQNQSGKETPNDWFRDKDATTDNLRITGFYSWVSVFWALQEKRVETLSNYFQSCNTKAWYEKKYLPVISTTPSYNEGNWGYTETSCGIGNRVEQPEYNLDHSTTEWMSNLDDSLSSAPSNAWLYIQAYDEWSEGTTIAPNTKSCFNFLSILKQKLYQHGWLAESSKYCQPDWPQNNVPEVCPPEEDEKPDLDPYDSDHETPDNDDGDLENTDDNGNSGDDSDYIENDEDITDDNFSDDLKEENPDNTDEKATTDDEKNDFQEQTDSQDESIGCSCSIIQGI